MSEFRVALSGDFLKADGSPTFPQFDLSPLHEARIETFHLQSVGEIDASELADVDALILLSHQFTRNSIPDGGRLALVARFGVGFDNVDVAACTENAIATVITPDGVRRPVAVSIITLILALAGKLLVKDRLARMGPEGWAQKTDHNGVGLVGLTLGSVGFGNIGQEMFRMAAPFDMKFMASDPYADADVARRLGVELVDLPTLFRRCDIVCVNCLLNDATEKLVGRDLLALMKPTAFLINTARGPIVDEAALVEVLRDGKIAGAGLDVFEQEPPPADAAILKLDNVIVTPHALCWTDQLFGGIGAADVGAVLDVLRGEIPTGLVDRAIADSPVWRTKLENCGARFSR